MFWENFYNLCLQKGVSPNAAAKEMNISSGTVTEWKNGREPQNATLRKVADYFGVTVDYLLGKSDVPNPQIPQEPAIPENSLTFHFNGKIGKKKLTKEQMAMLKAMLDAIPDTPLDD